MQRCSTWASEQYNWSNFKTHRTLWEFPASRQLYFYLFSSTSYTSIRLRVIRAGYEMVFNLTQKIALVRARTQTSVSSFGMQVAIITSFLQLKRNVALPYVDHFFITETGAANEIHEFYEIYGYNYTTLNR
ncbi:hypothetical protein TNCT_666231 [Trichonephila clavata]|uniref:Uncharacterized protein n=1 Tax=Trichonephila clavata TaxID=2740835 RepID=A0A8X6LLA2_TRICU|nr:hypothetical protein TNCT_666231 [Trichonephila clavata]